MNSPGRSDNQPDMMRSPTSPLSQAGFSLNRKPATSTSELVIRCQRQEREAQAEFYHKYKSDVARTAYRVFGPDADLEDVVQDVFIEAFRSIDRFKGEARVSTWLYRVAFNVALQRLRRRKRRRESALPDQPEREVEQPLGESPQQSLERREMMATVYRVLDQLSPKKRVVFVLHEMLGLDSKEIAEQLGTNVLTVRTRLHYARKEFYQLILETGLFEGALP